MKAKIGKPYLTEIPHEEGELTFQHPAFRGTFGSVAKQIDRADLERPSSPKTASLVYDAFQNPEGEHELEIIRILRDNRLWEFTGNLYLPKSNEEVNNGVILESNPRIINGILDMDKKSLIKRLQDNDPLVRFVAFGFKTGQQKVSELERNPYVLARYGEEGAQKIAKVASNYKRKPRLWTFNSVNRELIKMSALYDIWVFGYGLGVGAYWSDEGLGYAFGECNSEKSK